jgi:hypothetical protein
VLVFDGSAPTSKLRTQRDRRQSMLRNPERVELNEAQIVTGSHFVLECEEHLTNLLTNSLQTGKFGNFLISDLSNVRVVGSCVPGEGEVKIGQELRRIYHSQNLLNCYSGADKIVVVGNDSDLVLTCIACVEYHNFFVVNPYSLIMTHVGELMTHWVNAVPNRQLLLEHLPSFRVDFVFLMLLAGGDHFPGIEDDCVHLWRKYRKLRADGGFFRQTLIRESEVNWEFLRAVTARDHGVMQHYRGSKNKRKIVKAQGNSAPPEPGIQLLKGARWALEMVRGIGCKDYYFHFRGDLPKIGSLRAALNSKGLQTATRCETNAAPPLLPLQVYVAVIGIPSLLPTFIQRALDVKGQTQKFSQTTSVGTILSVVKDLFTDVDTNSLTPKEAKLMMFGSAQVLRGDEALPAIQDEFLPSSFVYPQFVEEILFKNLYDSRFVRVARLKTVSPPINSEPKERETVGESSNEKDSDESCE